MMMCFDSQCTGTDTVTVAVTLNLQELIRCLCAVTLGLEELMQ